MGRKAISEIEANKRLFKKHNGNIIMNNYLSLYSEANFKNIICGHEWCVVAYSTIESGHGCPTCARQNLKELLSTSEDEIVEKINEIHNGTIKITNYKSVRNNADFECLVCGHLWITSVQSVITQKSGCLKCSIRRKSGSNSRFWKGGITKLRSFIRESNKFEIWEEESMYTCHYKYVITGENFDEIHHLYPLNNIIKDALIELGLEKYEFVGNYSEEDMKPIIDKIIEIHYRYPLGVCLRRDIHVLFHKLYTKEHCTPEDFYEFVDKINSGEIEI